MTAPTSGADSPSEANPAASDGGLFIPSTLLVSEGDDRIDVGGASRRQIAGDDGDQRQEQRDTAEAQRIGRRDVVEQRSNDARDAERADQSDHHADGRERHALANDQPEHVGLLRAERDAHAHLLRALRHRERQHAVDADTGEEQGRGAEDAEHESEQAELPEAFAAQIFHRAKAEDRQSRIRLTNRAAHGRREQRGIARRANRHADVREVREAIRHIRDREIRRVVVHVEHADVGRHADHGEPFFGLGLDEPEPPPDRVGARPQLLGHRLVDHRHRRSSGAFGIGEVTALEQRQCHRLVEMRRDRGVENGGLFAFRHRAAIDNRVAAAAAGVERDEVGCERAGHARAVIRCGASRPRRVAPSARRWRTLRRS